MKLDKLVIANSLALATAILWVICTVIVVILPGFSLTVTSWWLHGLNTSVLGSWNLTLANFLLGGIVLVISAWVAGYIFGWAWEVVSKRQRT